MRSAEYRADLEASYDGAVTSRDKMPALRSNRLAWIASRALPWLLLVGLLPVVFNGVFTPLGNHDETLWAQGVLEMIQHQRPFTLTWQDQVVLHRPWLPFTLYSLPARWIDGELGLRLGPALCCLLSLLLVFRIGRLGQARQEVAALAVLLCVGIPTFYLQSRAVLSDPPLVVAVLVALLGTARARQDPRWLLLAGLGLGAGVAVKSLAGLVHALPLLPWLYLAARRHRAWRTLAAAAGLALALALPFYIDGLLRHGAAFWDQHLMVTLLDRARGQVAVSIEQAHSPLAYLRFGLSGDGVAYFAIWLGGLLAAAVVAVVRRDPRLGLLSSYGLGTLALLSALGTRLPTYHLPVLAAAALCAAGVYGRLTRRVSSLAVRLVAPAAALTLLAVQTLPLVGYEPSPAAWALGLKARQHSRPDETVHTVNWYAPALKFYARRKLVMVSDSPRFLRLVGGVDFLRAAGAIKAAPLPPSRELILVAGFDHQLAKINWLRVERVVARAGGASLVRARVVVAKAAGP